MDMTDEELRRLKDKGPYEHMMEVYNMYDKMPYKRDISICGPDSIVMVSGNIIKGFRYKLMNVYTINSKEVEI